MGRSLDDDWKAQNPWESIFYLAERGINFCEAALIYFELWLYAASKYSYSLVILPSGFLGPAIQTYKYRKQSDGSVFTMTMATLCPFISEYDVHDKNWSAKHELDNRVLIICIISRNERSQYDSVTMVIMKTEPSLCLQYSYLCVAGPRYTRKYWTKPPVFCVDLCRCRQLHVHWCITVYTHLHGCTPMYMVSLHWQMSWRPMSNQCGTHWYHTGLHWPMSILPWNRVQMSWMYNHVNACTSVYNVTLGWHSAFRSGNRFFPWWCWTYRGVQKPLWAQYALMQYSNMLNRPCDFPQISHICSLRCRVPPHRHCTDLVNLWHM